MPTTRTTAFSACLDAFGSCLADRPIVIVCCGAPRQGILDALAPAGPAAVELLFVDANGSGGGFDALVAGLQPDSEIVRILTVDTGDISVVLRRASALFARQAIDVVHVDQSNGAEADRGPAMTSPEDVSVLSSHGYLMFEFPGGNLCANGNAKTAIRDPVFTSSAFRCKLTYRQTPDRTRKPPRIITDGAAGAMQKMQIAEPPLPRFDVSPNQDELLDLVDEMSLQEQHARAAARAAAYKEVRLRSRLAFHLGTAVVANLRPRWRILRMPVGLFQAYSQYKRQKQMPTTGSTASDTEVRVFENARLGMVLRIHWQRIVVPQSEKGSELWLTPFLPQSREGPPVRIEMRRAVGMPEDSVAWAPGANVSKTGVAAFDTWTDGATLCCSHHGEAVAIEMRITGSGRLVSRLELREMTSNVNETSDRKAERPWRWVPESKSNVGRDVIWHAHQLMRNGQTAAGLDFARRHARGTARDAVHLLEANASLPQETAWLRHVNDYVRQFDLAPIELRPGVGSRFGRLHARAASKIERGPLVTVIMPAYEAAATIGLAAESILSQTWQPVELIIVDDASGDGTWPILQRLASSDRRVKILRNDCNVGPYVSKNAALQIATGAYITGHDADDWAHPQRLERQLDQMLRAGAKTVSIACMIRMQDSGRFNYISTQSKGTDDGVLREATMSCMLEAGFMRRHVGAWDSVRFAADSEMIARCEQVAGSGFLRLRQLAIICQDRETSLTNDPLHGISKSQGLSPTRMLYQDHWKEWHRRIGADAAYLPFPQHRRPFEAPAAMTVSLESVDCVLRGHAPQRPEPRVRGDASSTPT